MKTFAFSLFTGRKPLPVLAVVLALGACTTPNPDSNSYSYNSTNKLDSGDNWNLVAKDVWKEAHERLIEGGYNETSVALEESKDDTPFAKALNNFLVTEIVNSGVAVSPESKFTLSYTTQLVHYAADSDSPAREAFDVLPGVASSDTATQVLVDFSMTDNSQVRIRESKVYYVNDGDSKLYETDTHKLGKEAVKHLVSSNWYADDPKTAESAGEAEENKIDVMIDTVNGPIHNIKAATREAAQRCGENGNVQSKYLSQSFPTNDRTKIKAQFQCE